MFDRIGREILTKAAVATLLLIISGAGYAAWWVSVTDDQVKTNERDIRAQVILVQETRDVTIKNSTKLDILIDLQRAANARYNAD